MNLKLITFLFSFYVITLLKLVTQYCYYAHKVAIRTC
jgi:hypothetical protein